jgi:hypothetical protein
MGQLRRVLPVRFAAVTPLPRRDVVRMACCLDALFATPGRSWRLETAQLLLDARSCFGHSLASSQGVVNMRTAGLLDVAAGLLRASEQLHCDGEAVAAFAIEGLQGRLMEAAVGSGSIRDDSAAGGCSAGRQPPDT